MRKALLVIAMVAASFAGGAVVNGPGLAWFRGLVGLEPQRIEPLGGQDPSIAAPVAQDDSQPDPAGRVIEPEDNAPAEAERPALPPGGAKDDAGERSASQGTSPDPDPAPAERPRDPAPPSGAESAPRPLELGDGPPPLAAPSDPSSPPALEPPASPGQEPSQPTASRDPGREREREPGWGDAPGSAPATAFLPQPREGRPALDPSISQASIAGPGPSTPQGTTTPAKTASPPAGSGPPKPLVVEPASSPAVSPTAPATGSWADIRRRMVERGVTRYWAEGEPGGPSRFRCVVPLAGKGAVSQQFEAEADDVLAAAEAALRRIDLWRATSQRP